MARKSKTKIEISVPSEWGNKKDWESWGKHWEKSWRERKREGMLWFGIFLLAIGSFWYAATLGLILPDLFWPGVVLIIGAITVLKALINYIRG